MPKIPLPPAESMHLDSLAEVARGGMGSVELARVMDGRLTGQVLAVKRLHANIAEDPEFVSMFLDEAWMTAALKHSNVAQVVAWGNDDKGMFLAIELVQGVSLSRLLKEAQLNKEPFAERTVAYICSQICGALVVAHGLTAPDGTPLSLVHRDLTPANVLVSFDGVVKIIDFGIAKAEERISHTRTGQLKGKPAYMAPEQQRGGPIDFRADLFAFGVMMFEMLAGRRPWTSKGAFDVMMEIANDAHPDLGELRKGLNPEFVAIAHKCLEKKAENRFNSAAEIKARLDAWLDKKGFSSDDAQSLANFVLRNCQPQVLWWQEALRGEHNKKKKPTFKELEEKIDEEREKAAKAARKAAAGTAGRPPPPRPAAGGTVPMPAYRQGSGPDSGAPPSSGAGPHTPQPSSNNPPSVQPISSQPVSGQPSSSSNPRMGVGPSPVGGHGSGQYAATPGPSSSSAPAHNLGGTAFMAVSPFAQVSGYPPSPRAPSNSPGPPPSPYGPTPSYNPPSPSHGPPSPQAGIPVPVVDELSIEGATVPMGPGLLAATQNMLPEPPPRPLLPTAAMEIPKPPRRRSRWPLVLALVVLFLGGGFAGLWFFGDRIGIDLSSILLGKPAHPR
jgi:serine/threonine protein kinase